MLVHYHRGDRFIVQLVDPATRLRVDIFPDRRGALPRARRRDDGWLVLDLADILDHKLELLARASAASPIDPKHAADARALSERLRRPPPVVDPAVLCPDVYSQAIDARCERCEAAASAAWPLAPKKRIFELLGYV